MFVDEKRPFARLRTLYLLQERGYVSGIFFCGRSPEHFGDSLVFAIDATKREASKFHDMKSRKQIPLLAFQICNTAGVLTVQAVRMAVFNVPCSWRAIR